MRTRPAPDPVETRHDTAAGGPPAGPRARAAWGLPLLTAALATLAVGAAVSAGGPPADDPNPAPLPFLLVVLAAALVFAGVGALVAERRPRNPVGWSLAVVGPGLASVFAAKAWADLALVQPGRWPDPTAVAWVTNSLAPLALLAPTVLLLFFPDGALPSPRWRPVLWTSVAAAIAGALALGMRPDEIDASDFPGLSNPVEVDGPVGVLAGDVVPATTVLGTATLLAALGSQVVRYRRAVVRQRQQIKWIAYPAALNVVCWTATEFAPAPLDALLWVAGLAALAGLPVGAAVAILRHRLYDIDLLISRTLVYGVLSAVVVAVYVVVVAWLGALLQIEDSLAVSLVATGLAAVMFAPLRERVQRWVNRLVFGRRDDPYEVLSRLGRHLEAALAPAAALRAIVETVRSALDLHYTGLEVRTPDGEDLPAAESGVPGQDDPLRVLLVHQQEAVGTLVLTPRSRLRDADAPLIEDLARQAAAAVHAARLTDELQQARERLVAGREEERRRLRRDLHDGLGPQLAAQTLKVGSARALYPVRPQAADAILAELEVDVERALDDLRRLIEDLRPPALDELGLVGAVREAALRYRVSDVQVAVEADELPPLPAAVEVAAYRIVDEAVTNVVRHARARRCTVRLTCAAGDLVVEVVDDGVGPRRTWSAGVGLNSMRERAAELGGRCTLGTADGGGTRVGALLPIRDLVPHG
ncbi:histidine kinase/DNA gyrase B/HSP90-like ATPase [Blastococcus colisei]|uniref:Histidine kinase/DNA gyrase B/HSP90-like ATPase n=1 Tax=Blastococcus colisei TaxID=1564162 RepID=A0A543PC15_9ACTN|nr:histidine kinase [Blastococcus colisei]TQN41612.1 histidine kinase/DNA gyrase B/HSP90-like ATPase [Blastococcus colisei]